MGAASDEFDRIFYDSNRVGAVGADACVNRGDAGWILVASVLVFSMIPGLAIFEAGMLPAKYNLRTATQVLTGAPICCLLWFFFGFSFVFGPSVGGVIGNPLTHAAFNDVFQGCYPDTHVPASSYAMFQMMFAAISPLLITGAYAGRLSLRASLCLTTLWEVLVYYPVAHWIWGGGWLSRMGAQDFAGGIVIHTTAGTASVVCALVLGQRAGFDKAGGHFPPSSLPMVMVGGALLCTGWFGFTAGCVLNVDVGSRTAIAIVNTQLAAAISACVWALLVWRQRTPNLTDVLNGAIAGLAGITPCAGYVYPWKALIVGLLSGVLSYEFVEVARFRWGLDDALDVSAVHGVTGVVGSIAIGILANREIGGHSTGLVYDFGFKDPAIVSSLRFLGVQCLAVVVAGAYSALVTYAILRFLKAIKSLSDLQDSDDDDDDAAADAHHATGYMQVSAMARPTERTPLL